MSKNDKKDDGKSSNWVDTSGSSQTHVTDTTWTGNKGAADPVKTGGGAYSQSGGTGNTSPITKTGGVGTGIMNGEDNDRDSTQYYYGPDTVTAPDPIGGTRKDPDGPRLDWDSATRPFAPTSDARPAALTGDPWYYWSSLDSGVGTGGTTGNGGNGGRGTSTNTGTNTGTTTTNTGTKTVSGPRPTKTTRTQTSTQVQTSQDARGEKTKNVCKARPKDNRPSGGGGGRKRGFIPWC